MTLTLEDIEKFHDQLFADGDVYEIHASTIEHAIAKKYGISPYKEKLIMGSLVKFGFIQPVANSGNKLFRSKIFSTQTATKPAKQKVTA